MPIVCEEFKGDMRYVGGTTYNNQNEELKMFLTPWRGNNKPIIEQVIYFDK